MKTIESIGLADSFNVIGGKYKDIQFFVLNGEHGKHYPHIHICVNDLEGKIKGKRLKLSEVGIRENVTCVATLKLNKNLIYTKDSLVFNEVFNENYVTDEYKYLYIKWMYLNTAHRLYYNARMCINYYMALNKNFKEKRLYKKYISKNKLNKTLFNIALNLHKIFSKNK